MPKSDHFLFTHQNAIAKKSDNFSGSFLVPGDKSISHRALILGGLASGKTEIHGLLEGEDVLHTAKAMAKLGANIQKSDQKWIIYGVGNGCLLEPDGPLDFGNSGTGARLMMGLLATYPIITTFIGDDSLSKRPMKRILEPLQCMGAQILSQHQDGLPLTLKGAKIANPIAYQSPVPSAQLKSSVLLAALNTPSVTTFIEIEPTRNHTEIMLQNFGVKLEISKEQQAHIIQIEGQQTLTGQTIHIPGDPSSAAFLIVAALITKNSDIVLKNVLINETRIGLITTLLEMGANITYLNPRLSGGERIADIHVQSSDLKSVLVPKERAPFMIDEYPILAIASAYAKGQTKMCGLKELRVKESDRLHHIALGLKQNHVICEEGEDSLTIIGQQTPYQGGITVDSAHDHRIAMSFLIFGLTTQDPIQVQNAHMINTSFPNFMNLMQKMGANIDWL